MKLSRPEPIDVDDIEAKGIRYKVHRGPQSGAGPRGNYLTAFEANSNKSLWSVLVCPDEADPNLERDVQELFVTQFVLREDDSLEITIDGGLRFVVDPATHTVKQFK